MAKGSGGQNFSASRRYAVSSLSSVKIGDTIASGRNRLYGRVTGRMTNMAGRGPAFRIVTRDGSVGAIPYDEVLRR
jgi:hypothetical protein